MLATKCVHNTTIPTATVVGKGVKEFAQVPCEINGYSTRQWQNQGKVKIEPTICKAKPFKLILPEVDIKMCNYTLTHRAFQIFIDDKLYAKTGNLQVQIPNFSSALVMMHTFDENMNQLGVYSIKVQA